MILSIDHVVILVNDLASASTDYAWLGFTVVQGGEHADGATQNALIAFADGTYLELIAFKRPAPEHFWWRHVMIGEGLIDYALLPDDIGAEVTTARQRGLPMNGPTPGGRLRPDGEHIAWELARPPTPDLPFLCADVTPRERRVPGGAATQHANGIAGIAGLTVAVTDLESSSARYRALLGSDDESYDATRPGFTVPGLGVRLSTLPLGSAVILLAEPTSSGAGELRQHLAARGPGPFALALSAPAGVAPLDPARTHGARLELAHDA